MLASAIYGSQYVQGTVLSKGCRHRLLILASRGTLSPRSGSSSQGDKFGVGQESIPRAESTPDTRCRYLDPRLPGFCPRSPVITSRWLVGGARGVSREARDSKQNTLVASDTTYRVMCPTLPQHL